MLRGRKSRCNKYGNTKTTVDGILFDSKKEADYYCELKMLKMAGKVRDFERQVGFVLQNGYRANNGKWIRPIKYYADFVVNYTDGHTEVVDVKGVRTEVYKIKKKMLLRLLKTEKFREI